MNEIDERVSRHYGWSGLMETIEEEIRRNGIDPTQVTVDELAPVDNYHWHRLAGTLALARARRSPPMTACSTSEVASAGRLASSRIATAATSRSWT